MKTQLESVFYRTLHYCMERNDEFKFFHNQFDDIAQSIDDTLQFLNNYELDHMRKATEVYAVTCLPFLLAKFDITNPDTEDKKVIKETIDFFQYLKKNKLINLQYLKSISSDPDNFNFNLDEKKVDEQIKIHKSLISLKNTKKREWWSNVIQIQYLAKCVDIVWKSESKKLEFLEHFFLEFDKEVNSETIKKQMLIACRKNPLISDPESPNKILNHLSYLIPLNYFE